MNFLSLSETRSDDLIVLTGAPEHVIRHYFALALEQSPNPTSSFTVIRDWLVEGRPCTVCYHRRNQRITAYTENEMLLFPGALSWRQANEAE